MNAVRTIERLELALVELEYARADAGERNEAEPAEEQRARAARLLSTLRAAEYAIELSIQALGGDRRSANGA